MQGSPNTTTASTSLPMASAALPPQSRSILIILVHSSSVRGEALPFTIPIFGVCIWHSKECSPNLFKQAVISLLKGGDTTHSHGPNSEFCGLYASSLRSAIQASFLQHNDNQELAKMSVHPMKGRQKQQACWPTCYRSISAACRERNTKPTDLGTETENLSILNSRLLNDTPQLSLQQISDLPTPQQAINAIVRPSNLCPAQKVCDRSWSCDLLLLWGWYNDYV